MIEKIVVQRLNSYLERIDVISEIQCGFRSRRRTTDHIPRSGDIVYQAKAIRRSAIALFLDLEKACNMVFKDAVLLKLIKLVINGSILCLLIDYYTTELFRYEFPTLTQI